MKLNNLIEEDFVNYKRPGLFLGFPYCSGKCNPKDDLPICQNQRLHSAKLIDIPLNEIIDRFERNPITEALIFGGLEPFDSFDEMLSLILLFRKRYFARTYTIVIYTGYYPHEIKKQLCILKSLSLSNGIIVKFGRYIPGDEPHLDPYLGVNLASNNQYAIPLDDLWKGVDLIEYMDYHLEEKKD